jgi:hypothetical protein
VPLHGLVQLTSNSLDLFKGVEETKLLQAKISRVRPKELYSEKTNLFEVSYVGIMKDWNKKKVQTQRSLKSFVQELKRANELFCVEVQIGMFNKFNNQML